MTLEAYTSGQQQENVQRQRVQVLDLGLTPFAEAWALQTRLVEEIIQIKSSNRKALPAEQRPSPHHFIYCEHPPVYTLGRNGDSNHLLLNEQELAERAIAFFPINRGGDITYHGPGQLVGYPIFDLESFFTDIGRYVRTIEEAVILTLAEYGLAAGRIEGASGVWLSVGEPQARKICAIGIHLSRWVSMHGFAFNLNTDLNYFSHIVPCGIEDKGVTSLAKELGKPVEVAEVKEKLLRHFAQLFDFEPQFSATIP